MVRPPGAARRVGSAAVGEAVDEAQRLPVLVDRRALVVDEAALEADPLLAVARELRAQLLLDDGDDDGAEGELRATLFLDPTRPVAHATLGALLARRGERSRAAAAAAEVRRLLAGRAAGESLPGGGGLTVGRLLADLDTWSGPDTPERP